MSETVHPFIIFLDFDGVLTSLKWHRMKNEIRKSGETVPEDMLINMSPDRVKLLNRLDYDTFKVVVTSTWRLGRSTVMLSNLLAMKGLELEVIG